MKIPVCIPLLSIGGFLANSAVAQSTGLSTASTPYVLPTAPGYETISVLTTDNTGSTLDDVVPKVGGGTYGMDGIPDGLGAYDNGDGTFTLLVNHEIPSGLGVARAHGGVGAYISEFVINKNTLAVVSGQDLIKSVYGWNASTQSSNSTPINNAVFYRFCSADLAAPTAFFNRTSGLGSGARIFLNGEEDSTHGWAMAHVATGASKGNSYVLGDFNLSTNGSGLTGVGNWETLVACPFEQDKTVVIGNNDGGTGIMSNALAVYVGTKQNTGTEVDKAGLTNGTLKFVSVEGNSIEIVDGTSRATNITNGTRFTLSATTSTTFSRPEDGAWNPTNPKQYYFVTTDRLDQVADGSGAQIGQSRLWRLTFDDITQPDLGGKIDLLIDGRVVNGEKVNMFDNICVNEKTGYILLQEDVGGAAHNGKVWDYDPATDSLIKVLKHDVARFGDLSTPATLPFNNDEETSGIIDISAIMAGSTKHKGNPLESWSISSDQAHYTTGITASQVEGGQLFVVHDISPTNNLTVTRGGYVRDRRTGNFAQQVTLTNNNSSALAGPFYFVLDSLSSNASVSGPAGTTSVYGPLGSPFLLIPGETLAPGASVAITVQFANPTNAPITYTARVLNSISTP